MRQLNNFLHSVVAIIHDDCPPEARPTTWDYCIKWREADPVNCYLKFMTRTTGIISFADSNALHKFMIQDEVFFTYLDIKIRNSNISFRRNL